MMSVFEKFEVMAILRLCWLFIGKYAVSHENGQTQITQRVTSHKVPTEIMTLQMLSTILTTEMGKVFSFVK